MDPFLAAMTKEDTITENGMLAHSSTGSAVLDFFGFIGSARHCEKDQIINKFLNALAEDPVLALRTLFYARDIRGGAGERKVFRICMNALYSESATTAKKLLPLIPEYGRWDDVLALNDTLDGFTLIRKAIVHDRDGLCAKWMPRKGEVANMLRRYMGMTPKQYRKTLVHLSKTVEQQMCANQWEKIEYEHVPSCAMAKYIKAYHRQDGARFAKYIEAVSSGEKKINAATLFPYQLYKKIDTAASIKEREAIQALWNSLPDFTEGNDERILTICDTSGSMLNGYNPSPAEVALSLSLYLSERFEGPFKDCFVTFSDKPALQRLKGSLVTRLEALQRADWGANTNLVAVFDLILDKAVASHIDPKYMPTSLLILSDMQFDEAANPNRYWSPNMPVYDLTAKQVIDAKYRAAGYEVPNIIYWNLNGKYNNTPVRFDDKGVGLISGFTPAVLKGVLAGDVFDPVTVMLNTIGVERYDAVEKALGY